jgi:hypothetical protein
MKSVFFYWVLTIASLTILGCAQVVAPTGGPKDTTPPGIIRTIPKDQTTRFNSKRIYIYFDEYVQLNNPNQQVVISPQIEPTPELIVAGKSIVITLTDSLRKNTTYNINFGNAIVDVNEQNPLAGYTFSFATGDYIDSFMVKGVANQAFNLSACKSCVAALYDANLFTDSTLLLQKPVYFSKTTDAGAFNIRNLPDGSYKFVVYQDENKNLKWDKNEQIGFENNLVNPSDSAYYKIRTFNQDLYKPNTLLDSISTANGRFNFVFYKPTGINITNELGLPQHILYKPGEKNFDTLQVFIADTSIVPDFRISYADTSYSIKMRKSRVPRLASFQFSMSNQVELKDSIRLTLKNPIQHFDTSLMRLYEDTVQVKYHYYIDSINNALLIKYSWLEGTKYKFDVADSAMYDIYNQTNERKILEWTAKTVKDYANLIMHITNVDTSKHFIIQLMSEDEKQIYRSYQVNNSDDIEWNYIPPTKIKIKVIIDENKNGIWDNGDINTWKQPEKVLYYKDLVSLRAYWDMEITLDMDNLTK